MSQDWVKKLKTKLTVRYVIFKAVNAVKETRKAGFSRKIVVLKRIGLQMSLKVRYRNKTSSFSESPLTAHVYFIIENE